MRRRLSEIESGKNRKGAVVSTNTGEAMDKLERKLEKQKGSCRLNEYSRGDGLIQIGSWKDSYPTNRVEVNWLLAEARTRVILQSCGRVYIGTKGGFKLMRDRGSFAVARKNRRG